MSTRMRILIASTFFSAIRHLLYILARDITSSVTQHRTLVVAPHPDDETLGCGATITRLRRAGAVVRVLIVADGQASHTSGIINAKQLAEIRAVEVLAACAQLGVGADQVRLLQFPDGVLADREPELKTRLREEIAAFAPEQVFYPCGLDEHSDHQAVATAVEQILDSDRLLRRAYAYPVWFWRFSVWRRSTAQFLKLSPVKVKTKGTLEWKRAALSAHRSQFENLTGEAAWQVLGSSFTRHFFGPYELFFEYPLNRPHQGRGGKSPAALTGYSAKAQQGRIHDSRQLSRGP